MTGYASSTGVWATGRNDYARMLARQGTSIEARDLRHGDVILRRAVGATERTPHTISGVWGEGRDVVVLFSGSTDEQRISKTMRVTFEALV